MRSIIVVATRGEATWQSERSQHNEHPPAAKGHSRLHTILLSSHVEHQLGVNVLR